MLRKADILTCYQQAIGDRLGLDFGTLTPLLKRMETAGYLHRTRDPDQRLVRVSLTKSGIALRAKLACVPELMAAATGKQQKDLLRMKDELLRLRGALNTG